jgi:hypothetical protein
LLCIVANQGSFFNSLDTPLSAPVVVAVAAMAAPTLKLSASNSAYGDGQSSSSGSPFCTLALVSHASNSKPSLLNYVHFRKVFLRPLFSGARG